MWVKFASEDGGEEAWLLEKRISKQEQERVVRGEDRVASAVSHTA